MELAVFPMKESPVLPIQSIEGGFSGFFLLLQVLPMLPPVLKMSSALRRLTLNTNADPFESSVAPEAPALPPPSPSSRRLPVPPLVEPIAIESAAVAGVTAALALSCTALRSFKPVTAFFTCMTLSACRSWRCNIFLPPAIPPPTHMHTHLGSSALHCGKKVTLTIRRRLGCWSARRRTNSVHPRRAVAFLVQGGGLLLFDQLRRPGAVDGHLQA